ncbi:MAG: hypothetical protein RJA90_1242 [Bacteroidota bacterium]
MIKFTKHFLKKLEDLLSELGFVLRYEKGNFQSGYCLVEHRNILVDSGNTRNYSATG